MKRFKLISIILLTAICFTATAGAKEGNEDGKNYERINRKWVFKDGIPAKSIAVRYMSVKKGYSGKTMVYKEAYVSYRLALRAKYNGETRIDAYSTCYWERGKMEVESKYDSVWDCNSSGGCTQDIRLHDRPIYWLSNVVGSTFKIDQTVCEKLVPQIESGKYVGAVKEAPYSKRFDEYLRAGKRDYFELTSIYMVESLSKEQIDKAISLDYHLKELFEHQTTWMTDEQE